MSKAHASRKAFTLLLALFLRHFLFGAILWDVSILLFFRDFYHDWWNADNIARFWSSWNLPVHRYHTCTVTLTKKKRKFSSCIRKFRRDRLQSLKWLTASLYMVKYLRISSCVLGRSSSSLTLLPFPPEFPYMRTCRQATPKSCCQTEDDCAIVCVRWCVRHLYKPLLNLIVGLKTIVHCVCVRWCVRHLYKPLLNLIVGPKTIVPLYVC